jgi:hypothetical protein
MTAESNPPAKRGCLFYGLLTLAIGGFLLLLAVGFAVYAFKQASQRWVQDYTDAAPALIEKVEYTPAQMEALRAKWAAFQEAMDRDRADELALNAEDLNALIYEDQALRGRLFVHIDGERLKGEVSIPLEDLGPFKLQGRYLNGAATFKVGSTNGGFDVRLDDVKVKTRPLPRAVLSELRKQNLAQNVQKDPKLKFRVAKLGSVVVTNGQVILRSK